MKYPEREAVVEGLPYESRLGFIAYAVERGLNEARRHPVARAQLEKLPLLTEGLEMLWARAERGVVPDPERVRAVREHLATYQRPAMDGENMSYNYDVTLVHTASTLNRGMRLLQDPQVKPRAVAGALEGPVQSVGVVYDDWSGARAAEVANIDTALERLRDWGAKPFSRAAFGEIPEWARGELAKKYAEGRVTGTDVNQAE
jgi:hypothetical protein